MRVSHVITRLIVGGAQENTVASVLGLRQDPAFDVRLISGPTSGPEGSLESCFDFSFGILTLANHLVRPVHPWKDCLALAQLTRLFRAQRPHLVHTHSGKAGILGRLAARRAGVPLIVHTIHGPSFGLFQNRAANLLFRSAERFAARWTTHFVTVADAMGRQYLAAGIGRPNQFTRIWSGFELKPFLTPQDTPNVRARLGFAPADIVVGTVARLAPLKGHDDLLDAAPALLQSCPRMRFLIIGDGPWRKRIEAKAQAIGLQRCFTFTGLVPPVQIPPLFGAMDVLIHLSRREGLARALPQALATGRPVIAYDSDGAGEVCLTGETGFLVPLGDRQELIERLLQLAGDAALRDRLGEQGRRFVSERFSIDRMVQALRQLYHHLAKTRPDALSS